METTRRPLTHRLFDDRLLVLMSSRLYPRYVYGNPQLRIFLPDFWMILVRPKDGPPNQVSFRVHPRMTENDVRNYLEKIYKLKVCNIRSAIHAGEMPMSKTSQYLVKKYDYRLCHVSLPVGTTFTHPKEDLFLVDGKAPDSEELENAMENIEKVKQKFRDTTWKSGRHLPTWWSASN